MAEERLGVVRFERYGGSKIYGTRAILETRAPRCSTSSFYSSLACAFHLPSHWPTLVPLLGQGSALQSLPQRHILSIFLSYCKTYHLHQTFYLIVPSLVLFYSYLKYAGPVSLKETENFSTRDWLLCVFANST